MWLLPAAGGSVAGSMLAPLLARRTSPALVVSAGLVLAAGGFAVLTQVDQTADLALLVAGSVVFSLGIVPVGDVGDRSDRGRRAAGAGRGGIGDLRDRLRARTRTRGSP